MMASEDITFCFSDCKIKSCPRNKKNIKQFFRTHSFAYFEGTEYCEKKQASKKMKGGAE